MAHTTLARFRSLSNAAYICLFGYLWLGIGALGIVLAIIKDASARPVRVRACLLLADGLTIAALLLLYNTLPAFLGLARGLIILMLAAAHGAIYSRSLYNGRIIAWEK